MSLKVAAPGRRPALLYGIDWLTYSRFLRIFQDRPGHRLTYDRGILEIMSPSWIHEEIAAILGCFIEAITDELSLPRRVGRCVSLRRRRFQKGIEPDNCYWLASTFRVQGKTRLDLAIDPPPDLAIEVEITHSPLKKLSIYTALGVPELWWVDSKGLTFLILEAGSYQTRTHSLSFPKLASADLPAFLDQLGQVDDTALVRQFRDWVRQQLLIRP